MAFRNVNKVFAIGCLATACAAFSTSNANEIFEWHDAAGKHHYSDRSHQQARILQIAPSADYYLVKKVYDGDTVLLENGWKVRLLGINTPEVAGRYKVAEAGGEAAKTWLIRELEGKTVRLEYDAEKQDAYRRVLAHLFSSDRKHINLELVKLGYATVAIHPPNLKYAGTLLAAQAQAERERLGIWQDAHYAAVPAEQLADDNYKGWKRITGRVRNLKLGKKYCYLELSDQVSVGIDGANLDLFPALEGYLGRRIEARGWVRKSRQRFVLGVRHPGEIKEMK